MILEPGDLPVFVLHWFPSGQRKRWGLWQYTIRALFSFSI